MPTVDPMSFTCPLVRDFFLFLWLELLFVLLLLALLFLLLFYFFAAITIEMFSIADVASLQLPSTIRNFRVKIP
jgi:hypothetical protein